MSDLSPTTEFDLAALADGSLAEERRAEVSERLKSSSELSNELDLQQSALSQLRASEIDAPDWLHSRVQALVDAKQDEHRSPRARFARARCTPYFAGIGLSLAVCAAVVAVILSGGTSQPQLSDAFALTMKPATVPAPSESHSDRSQLDISVEGVSFPYWRERFGWRTSGARTDHLAGHPVTTVFYSNKHGQRVGYAILAGPALKTHGGTVVWHHGIRYRVLSDGGTPVVTWMRSGHLCVISGHGLSSHTLLKLASWSELKPSSTGEST